MQQPDTDGDGAQDKASWRSISGRLLADLGYVVAAVVILVLFCLTAY